MISGGDEYVTAPARLAEGDRWCDGGPEGPGVFAGDLDAGPGEAGCPGERGRDEDASELVPSVGLVDPDVFEHGTPLDHASRRADIAEDGAVRADFDPPTPARCGGGTATRVRPRPVAVAGMACRAGSIGAQAPGRRAAGGGLALVVVQVVAGEYGPIQHRWPDLGPTATRRVYPAPGRTGTSDPNRPCEPDLPSRALAHPSSAPRYGEGQALPTARSPTAPSGNKRSIHTRRPGAHDRPWLVRPHMNSPDGHRPPLSDSGHHWSSIFIRTSSNEGLRTELSKSHFPKNQRRQSSIRGRMKLKRLKWATVAFAFYVTHGDYQALRTTTAQGVAIGGGTESAGRTIHTAMGATRPTGADVGGGPRK